MLYTKKFKRNIKSWISIEKKRIQPSKSIVKLGFNYLNTSNYELERLLPKGKKQKSHRINER